MLPTADAGRPVGALHYLYDGGYHLALGVACAGLAWGWRRTLGSRKWSAYVGIAAVVALAAPFTLSFELSSTAFRLAPQAAELVLGLLVGAVAVVFAASAWVSVVFARRGLRAVPFLGALGVAAANHYVLANDYPAVHLYLGAASLVVGTAALGGIRVRFEPSKKLLLAVAAAGALAVAIPPSNATLLGLLRVQGAFVTPYVARVSFPGGAENATIPPSSMPWFADRKNAPAVAASLPGLLPTDGVVVVFVTVDSLRADVLHGREYDTVLPNLARLRDESVTFTNARTPGSQTVVTLAEVFAGRYYSQLRWASHPDMPPHDFWPHRDPSPRFPELLRDRGVRTTAHVGATWLLSAQGITRGFDEETFPKPERRRYATTAELFSSMEKSLDRGGPAFLFAHLLDAHATVRLRSKDAGHHERYIDNLAVVDEQLGALRKKVESLGLAQKCVWIISSDHGEAFGEHKAFGHGVTLYDELLRVPLLLHVPGRAPRVVHEPVSIIDVGPTVLDLFGLPTPGTMMGQSLTDFARGRTPELTRPIVAEGRLKKAMVFPDGHKVIVDDRHHVAEVYDLDTDPGELHNLLDSEDAEAWKYVGLLRKFFGAHTLWRIGYRAPYRR